MGIECLLLKVNMSFSHIYVVCSAGRKSKDSKPFWGLRSGMPYNFSYFNFGPPKTKIHGVGPGFGGFLVMMMNNQYEHRSCWVIVHCAHVSKKFTEDPLKHQSLSWKCLSFLLLPKALCSKCIQNNKWINMVYFKDLYQISRKYAPWRYPIPGIKPLMMPQMFD